MKHLALYFFWLAIAAISAWTIQPNSELLGQASSAAIKGKVTDPSDAVVADANLIIREKQTGAQRVAETQLDGQYQVESLDPGEYEMQVSAEGFGTEVYSLALRVGEYLTVNFRLKVGQLTETVAVNGPISGVNTGDFSINGRVGRFQIESLPLNGRNFLELARLEPGVDEVSVANPEHLGITINVFR